MIIKRIEFKNFKSYGNKKQTIDFIDDGGLILLSGDNGSGKTTIKNVIDLCLFNKVPGKKKNISLAKLPNRINKNLYCSVEFKNYRNDNINISKYIEPNKMSVIINDVDETKTYKNMDNDQKDYLIGLNYESYKSFISLSMNDFKDFIVLNDTEKNNLINKICNLEKIDKILYIIKEQIKQIQKSFDFNKEKLNNNMDLLKNTENILKNINTKNVVNVDELKNELKSKKPIYDEMVLLIQNKNKEVLDIDNLLRRYNNSKYKQENDIKIKKIELSNIQEKLSIFEQGKCPFCESELNDDKHSKKLNELSEKKLEIEKTIKLLEEEYSEMNLEIIRQINKQKQLKNEQTILDNNFSKLKNELVSIKNKIQIHSNEPTVNSEQLKIDYDKLKDETYQIQKVVNELKEKISKYNTLERIINENDNRKSIIKKTTTNINKYLKEFSSKTNLNFDIELDDNFNTKINQLYEIDPDLLSNGEDRKINIIIALSYLCTIIDKKSINILFIDELFNSIDKNNINLILSLLKEISKKYKLNIILVHHYLEIIDLKYFDIIYEMKKDIFSDISIRC